MSLGCVKVVVCVDGGRERGSEDVDCYWGASLKGCVL